MRRELLSSLRCPLCSGLSFTVEASEENAVEIREGSLRCSSCQQLYLVESGILDLMPNPNKTIVAEQHGWVELLGETNDALVETMLQLPYLEDPVWRTTWLNYDEVMTKFDVRGKHILDIGAGRCWSTRRFMLAGAQSAVALDILRTRYIGLETADIFLEHDGIYFDRLIGDMNGLPFQTGAFDIVFMTGTLHHSSDPGQTLQETARVLAPKGLAVLVNEPVRSPNMSGDLTGCVEIDHGINENVYTLREYLGAARKAGLAPTIYAPGSLIYELQHDRQHLKQELGPQGYQVLSRLWDMGWGGRLFNSRFFQYAYLFASMPLIMIAQKR